MKKQIAVKEDGRLIVYYSFPRNTNKSKELRTKNQERGTKGK